MHTSKPPVQISARILTQIASLLQNLWSEYSCGNMKYMQYAIAYDKVFERFGITKRDLLFSVQNHLTNGEADVVQPSYIVKKYKIAY